MNSQLMAYLFGDIICLIMMLIIGYNSKRQLGRLLDEKLFLETILTAAMILISDIIWALVDGKNQQVFRILNIVTSGFYLFMTVFVGLIWLIFVDFKLKNEIGVKFKKRIVIYSLPMVIIFLITVTSPFNGLLYYIDENNHYMRGPLHFIQVAVGIIYILLASIMTLLYIRKTSSGLHKKEAVTLMLFAVFPLIGIIMQIFISNLPLTGVGISFAILVVFVNVQNRNASCDQLTGLNNRRQLNKFVDMVLEENKPKNKSLYFILIDIDKFKYINDNYGHLEGDKALTVVADLLAGVGAEKNDFVARYGGDEFAVVCERKNSSEIEETINGIKNTVDIFNLRHELDYKLSLSIGYAEFIRDGKGQDEVIAKADNEMYKAKMAKKAAGII